MLHMPNSAACLLCATPINGKSGFCEPCTLQLPYLYSPCARCALELGQSAPTHGHCEQCLLEPPYFDYCLALGRYEYPLQTLISRFKFNAKLSAGRAMSIALLQEIERALRQRPPDALLPVPLHSQRIRGRGFNQSTEIAKQIASRFKIPIIDDYCHRVRATTSQRGLSATARAENLKEAFVLKQGIEHWRHIAVVDDVVTTKSTVNAIAQLLKSQGVMRVGVICLARVSETVRTDI